MKQIIPKTVTGLLARGEEAIGGLDQFGAALNVSRVTKAIVVAKVNALRTKRDAYDASNVVVKTSRSLVDSLVVSTVDYMQTARDGLKQRLGKKHNASWVPAGFPEKFAVDPKAAVLQERAYSMFTFLAANPTFEVADLGITSARGEGLFNDLKAARNTLNLKLTELSGLRTDRDAAMKELESALRQLISELSLAMGPFDARWTAFGLNKPGVKETPEVPEDVIAVLIGNNAVSLKWTSAARAEYYRVYAKINGVNEELIAVGSPSDLDFTLEGVPAATKVELAVSAVNNGGESQRSEVVTVTTH